MRVSLHVCVCMFVRPFFSVDYYLSIHPSTKRLERAGKKRKVVERDGEVSNSRSCISFYAGSHDRYSWFYIKGTWSVHSFNGDYLSIHEGTVSCGYIFHEIPGMRKFITFTHPPKDWKLVERGRKGSNARFCISFLCG